MARPYEVAKAGWMHRQTSVLKRWKKNWFALYQSGDLKYFESPDSTQPEECVVVRAECVQILQGKLVNGVVPPEGKSKDLLLQLKLRTGELTLCAEDADDMRTWQLLLEDARILRNPPTGPGMGAPPPYPGTQPPYPVQQAPPHQVVYTNHTAYPPQQVAYAYPGQVIYGSNPGPYVQPAAGQTTVIYADDPYYYRRRRYRDDMATGFVAGAALGTMMWTPMFFW